MINQDERLTKRDQLDDIISRCGSISGETFVSLRSRRDCPTLRQHTTDLLARNLKEYHASSLSLNCNDFKKQIDSQSEQLHPETRQFFNKSFHYYRFVVAMMVGTSVGIMMVLRYNITIAILRMVNQTHLYLEEHPNKTVEDFLDEGYALGGEFNWNNEIVAIILSWYMITYTLPQTLMAKLSGMLGSRTAVPLSLATCAISTLITPAAAYLGWEYVVGVRLLGGIGASAIIPCMLNLIENWMRYDEISAGLSIAQLVISAFNMATPLLSGYLTEVHWAYAFYVPGLATLVFCFLWLVMISEGPNTNWLISERELNLICDCDRNTTVESNNNNNNEQKLPASVDPSKSGAQISTTTTDTQSRKQSSTDTQYYDSYKPDSWTQILRVPSFYAYIVIWIFYCCSCSGFLFTLPAYMRQFLKVRITENGIYCSLIQLGCMLAVLWPHQLLKLLQKMNFSITPARIISHAICCFVCAATWSYVGIYHDSQFIMLFINRAAHQANDIIITGSLMSNFAKAGLSGMAFAMINTVGNFSIIGVSTFYGWLLDYTGASRQGWLYIYTSLGGSQIIMFLMFAMCVRSGPIIFRNKVKASTSIEEQPASYSEANSQQKRKLTNESNKADVDNLAKLKRLADAQQTKS